MNDAPLFDDGPGDLLARATDDLQPDVQRLVADGVRRGRRLRRRRAIAQGGGVLAVVAVAVAGVASVVAVSGGSGSDHAIDPAAHTPSPSATSGRTSTARPTADAPRQLAVTGRTIPQAFARLHPGSVELASTKEIDSPDPVVDFRWNGYAVRVGLTSDSYVTGTRIPDPMARCVAEGGGPMPCVPGPDDTVLQTYFDQGPAADGGVTVRMVTVFRPDGWDVGVSAANAADTKGGPALSQEPPFTMAQLEADAESDVWFQPGSS